uniref:Uncharacterized protein n=1 Tax=Arundo donax TaxID=35708 RepID=A0A0A8YKM9_ARUDO
MKHQHLPPKLSIGWLLVQIIKYTRKLCTQVFLMLHVY